jgi:hypothetical protein
MGERIEATDAARGVDELDGREAATAEPERIYQVHRDRLARWAFKRSQNGSDSVSHGGAAPRPLWRPDASRREGL